MSHYPTSAELSAHREELLHRGMSAACLDPSRPPRPAPDRDFMLEWLCDHTPGAHGSERSIGIGYRDARGSDLYMPVSVRLYATFPTYQWRDTRGVLWAGAWAGAWWAALLRGYTSALRPAGLLLRLHLIQPPTSQPTNALERAYGIPLGWHRS